MDIKSFINGVAETTKKYIEKYQEYEELTGEQKKARVDDLIANYIEIAIDGIGLNFIFKFVLKKLLMDNIPIITQAIFNLIQSKVKGITK